MSKLSMLMRSIGVAGVAGLMLVPTVGAVGVPTARPEAAKLPLGTAGQFDQVTVVPHSTDVWVVGGNDVKATGFVARRHDGKWQRMKTGGAIPYAVAAGSSKVVWAVGKTHAGGPWLGRWHGDSFVTVKLAGIEAKFSYFTTISASSPNNAWAAGSINTASLPQPVVEHWNGKSWQIVPLPTSTYGLTEVSTTSPTNVWALDGAEGVLHWNGKAWSLSLPLPANVSLAAVVGTSPKNALAVGSINSPTGNRTYITHFNGTKWTREASPNPHHGSNLTAVTMRGSSAWAVGFTPATEIIRGVQTDVSLGVILHSRGGTWRTQPVGHVALQGVSAASTKRVYAVGGGGTSTIRAALVAYNGHTWKAQSAKI